MQEIEDSNCAGIFFDAASKSEGGVLKGYT